MFLYGRYSSQDWEILHQAQFCLHLLSGISQTFKFSCEKGVIWHIKKANVEERPVVQVVTCVHEAITRKPIALHNEYMLIKQNKTLLCVMNFQEETETEAFLPQSCDPGISFPQALRE